MNIQSRHSGRKRMMELREKRARQSVVESVNNSKSMIVVNLITMIITGIILMTGLAYLLSFMKMQYADTNPSMYRLTLVFVAVFTLGWLSYILFRIRLYVRRLYRLSRNQQELSDN